MRGQYITQMYAYETTRIAQDIISCKFQTKLSTSQKNRIVYLGQILKEVYVSSKNVAKLSDHVLPCYGFPVNHTWPSQGWSIPIGFQSANV